ncbi:hypothetical protein [Oceanirhabdus sp. W0125-5]|uniref:hypothetical protein n=1 Tax=Oceanirhabdus sp. W0125-5 TaxID=2999116 RepID=UPI0022F3064D|nr:hypothetical protein [Oceanirhabdus sp. W0125-5]WBW95549.1 hypothetical protein OW730_17875 [Oceanirhabdus sp. W0125-5]
MNLDKNKLNAIANRLINRAIKMGYKKEDLDDCYIEDLLKQTKSLRIRDFIELSYYKGIFKGFQYVETLLNITDKKNLSSNDSIDLKKQNAELINRLETLNEMVLNIKEPPKSTGKMLTDGRSFVSFRNEYSSKIRQAIKTASENKDYLEEIK